MKRVLPLLCAVVLVAAFGVVVAQTRSGSAHASSDAALKARIEAFLNRTIGWQDLDKMEVESISAPDASGLRTVKVLLAKGDQHEEGKYFITADDKEIIEGEVNQLSGDPWAETRSKLELQGVPAQGAASAPVTVVEFSDLECPYCKQEAQSLAQLMQEEPGEIRVVFKYFPLVKIHPWAMQAALGAACVAEHDPTQFWNFEKTVFEDQDQITPDNAAQRLHDIALESGITAAAYSACLANPATQSKVDASIANGTALGVVSTPTLFINGRMIPGAVAEPELKLLVDHESTFGVHAAGLDGKVSGQQCGECKPLPAVKH